MGINTSKSEDAVPSWKRVECLLWVRDELLHQVEEISRSQGLVHKREENRVGELQKDLVQVCCEERA